MDHHLQRFVRPERRNHRGNRRHDPDGFVLSANGAVAQSPTITVEGGSGNGGDSGMGLTDYLLIILVILIVIMAIIVALRLMRN